MKQYVIASLILMMSASLIAQTDLHRIIATQDEKVIFHALKEKVLELSSHGERIYYYLYGYKDIKEFQKFNFILGRIAKKLAEQLNATDENISMVMREKLSSTAGVGSLISLIQQSTPSDIAVDYIINTLQEIFDFMNDNEKMKAFKEYEWIMNNGHEAFGKPNSLNMSDIAVDESENPQMVNVLSKNSDRFRELIHNPILVDYLNIPDDNGQTVLHIAAKYGLRKTVRRLIMYGASRHALDNRGNTAAHVLISHMPTTFDIDPNKRSEILYPSIHTLSLLIFLVETDNPMRAVNPDNQLILVQNRKGETIEHLLAAHPSGGMIRMFLQEEKGLSTNNIQDNNGNTPVNIARAKKQEIIDKSHLKREQLSAADLYKVWNCDLFCENA